MHADRVEAIPPKLYGGTERVISWLTDELVALGHEVVLYASGVSQTSAQLDRCRLYLRLPPESASPRRHPPPGESASPRPLETLPEKPEPRGALDEPLRHTLARPEPPRKAGLPAFLRSSWTALQVLFVQSPAQTTCPLRLQKRLRRGQKLRPQTQPLQGDPEDDLNSA